MESSTVASTDQTRTDAGSRPARSAESRTTRTIRASASSVRKVCRTTPSATRPASSSDLSPIAIISTGIRSSKLLSWLR